MGEKGRGYAREGKRSGVAENNCLHGSRTLDVGPIDE